MIEIDSRSQYESDRRRSNTQLPSASTALTSTGSMNTILLLALIAILVDCRCGKVPANPPAHSSAVHRNVASKALAIRSARDGLDTCSAARSAAVVCSSNAAVEAAADR